MKRFLVFAGNNYYPGGGWSDFVSAHDTVDEARGAVTAEYQRQQPVKPDWHQIVDTERGVIVDEGARR